MTEIRWDLIVTAITGIVGGTGLSQLITALVSRKKAKADILDTNIDAAIHLRDAAFEQCTTLEKKLQAAEQLLKEANECLKAYNNYIDILTDILDEYQIEYPRKEDYI